MYNFSYVAHTHTCTHNTTPHHTTPHHTVNYVLQVPIMYVQYLPSHHGLVIRTWRLCQLFSSGEPPARHSGHACLGLRRARDRLAFAAYHTRQSIAVRTCSLSSCLSRSHPQSYDAPRLYSFPRIPPPGLLSFRWTVMSFGVLSPREYAPFVQPWLCPEHPSSTRYDLQT